MFKLHPLFKLRTEVTPGIIALLQGTVLGTKGAKYKHLDTSKMVFVKAGDFEKAFKESKP